MNSVAVLLIPLLLIAFWAWMFHDMLNNVDIPSTEPANFRWPPVTKNQWIIFFIVLTVFAAGYYYFSEYKN